MSVTLFDHALWLKLPPIPKFVLAALCDRANLKTGKCWPSTKYISLRVSLSERRVQDHLKALEEMGYVERLEGTHGPGRTITRRVNVQRIIEEGRAELDAYRTRFLHEEETPDDSSGDDDADNDDRPVNTGRKKSNTGRYRPVNTGRPTSEDPLDQPSLDPLEEPSTRAREDKAILTLLNSRRSDLDQRTDKLAARFGSYGVVNVGTSNAIAEAVADFGIDWVEKAVKVGQGAGFTDRPPWNYIVSMLERWKRQGGPDEPKQETGNGRGRIQGVRVAAELDPGERAQQLAEFDNRGAPSGNRRPDARPGVRDLQ